MASIKHSTPKVSAYSMYTRNKKLTEIPVKKVIQAKSSIQKNSTDVPERRVMHTKQVAEAKTKNSKLDIKGHSRSKRKSDDVTIVNGTATEEQVVKKRRGRKKRTVVQETLDAQNSHSEEENEVEAQVEENGSEQADENNASPKLNVSAFKKQTVACGNEAAEEAFRWLLSPVKPEVFFEEGWEKKPFLIQRSNSNYYKGLYSTKEFEKTVKQNYLSYDREIDVVTYVDNERIEEKNGLRVFESCLWSKYHEGFSIRMRNPQVYHKPLGSLCSLLQEYFSSFVGANMYLTPDDAQGFPPHYDDIDAFILQIEGKKLWKLYTPRENEMLARYSSPDLKEEDIGDPCMEVELNAGDMLYFPRGFIHQAKTVPGIYSMHITLSTNQLNTWGDLLKNALANAIDTATENDIEFRESIPKDYLDYMGSVYKDSNSKERIDFEKKVYNLLEKNFEYLDLDRAADEQSIEFIHGSMPPFTNDKEKARSFFGNGARFINGKVRVPGVFNLQTKIRFIRRRAVRLVMDLEGVRLYHTLNNALNHKEREISFVEMDSDIAPALTTLYQTHPDYIEIKDLPAKNPQKLLENLQLLYDNGLLMTEEPLPDYE